jgi:hypothetical protein
MNANKAISNKTNQFKVFSADNETDNFLIYMDQWSGIIYF